VQTNRNPLFSFYFHMNCHHKNAKAVFKQEKYTTTNPLLATEKIAYKAENN